MPGIQIDSDNSEIRVGGQEYVSTKVSAVSCFGTVSDGNNSAVADQYNDTLTISPGTGISVVVATQSDTVTIGNTGVTALNGGTGARFTYSTFTDGIGTPTSASSGHVIMTLAGTGGVSVVTSPDTATISLSQVSIVKPSNSPIDGAQSPSPVAILTTGLIPVSTTIELSGVIWFNFSNAGGTNTYEISLTTTNGNIFNNVLNAAIGFSCHYGQTLGTPGEATKAQPSFVSQQISNVNVHTIRFSGIFQTDAVTANNLRINIKNNNTVQNDQLTVYAKSFMKYNIL